MGDKAHFHQFETGPKERSAMVAQIDPDVENLFDKLFSNPSKNQCEPILTSGQVKSMEIPQGWVARPEPKLAAGAGLTEFHAPGNDNIRLNSFYRGSRVNSETAEAFKECLAMPPHQLQGKELKALQQLLGDKSYNFDFFFARTMDLNGKRVLAVEGTYKDPAHTGCKTIYVDSDGTGSAVQEISYSAAGKDYQRHLTEAEKAFKSIIWQ